jgi:cation:H+ antiporter
VVCAAAIWWSGSRLPVHGKTLAERLGIGAAAAGLFVLALITSLPELSVTLSAMIREEAPDLALGNILGSNNFNLTIVALLEMAFVGGAFLKAVDSARYTKSCISLLLLTAMVGAGVVFGEEIGSVYLPVLLFSVPIALVFIVESVCGEFSVVDEPEGEGCSGQGAGMEVGQRSGPGAGMEGGGRERTTAWHAAWFALLAIVVVAAGFVMARSANRIALHEFPGGIVLGQTLVGTLLVAIATSLPEVTVSFAAVRRAGSPDMALGTLLGSNSLNILIFALGAGIHVAVTGTSAWADVSSLNMVNVVAGLVLTAIVLAGLKVGWFRSGSRRHGALLLSMIPIYLFALWLIHRGSTWW